MDRTALTPLTLDALLLAEDALREQAQSLPRIYPAEERHLNDCADRLGALAIGRPNTERGAPDLTAAFAMGEEALRRQSADNPPLYSVERRHLSDCAEHLAWLRNSSTFVL